jgi:hypothetical protein
VRRYRRNSDEDQALFLAWLPPEIRELVQARGDQWRFERARWYNFFVRTGAFRDARAAAARGELFLFDPSRHTPRWIRPVPPAPRRSPHDQEWGQNPGDEGLRRKQRELAAGAGPDERAAFANRRKRAGESVDPWELVPVSYVFLDAWHEIQPKIVLTTPTSGSLDLDQGRVEAYRGEAFKPWVMDGGYPDKAERFYVTACSYPLLAYGQIPSHYVGDQEDELESHLKAVEGWRKMGAIVVRLDRSSIQEHHDAKHFGTGPDSATCSYCRFSRDSALRVLVMEYQARPALTIPMVWGGRVQDVLSGIEQWDWARLMKRVGKRWKNPRGSW